jgi:23S rRNA (uracil1939-C5)-methyltransferase
MKVLIERLGHHGDGIGHSLDGQQIFTGGFLPGEEVEGTLDGDRLTDARILTPSPHRVKPPCQHARTCGGCLIQHGADSFVAEWKTGIILGALAGQGISAPLRPIVTSPARSRRRATLTGKKTKSGAMVGFHARASDMLVEVPNCQLLHPDLMAAMPALEAFARIGATRTQDVTLTVTQSMDGMDISVANARTADMSLQMDLARVVEAHQIARLTWNGDVVAMRMPPRQQMGRARPVPPPGAFMQATAEGEVALLAAVQEITADARRITDLFAGIGTFALPLAERADIHAVEGEASMTEALQKAANRTDNLHRLSTEARDLFRRPLEPDEFKGVEAVVIDPPRAGAEAQIATLAQTKVPRIAMVSCNPATFARDARVLINAGWSMDWVQPVDQFRWSAHVELVGAFRRG